MRDQTREERFKRLAEQRVNVILDKLRLLGQLSNRGNYEYTDVPSRRYIQGNPKGHQRNKVQIP